MTLMLTVLTGVLGLLPTYDPPSFEPLGTELGAGLASANALFPVTVLGGCLAAVIGLRLFLLVWDFIIWLYRLIPLKAT